MSNAKTLVRARHRAQLDDGIDPRPSEIRWIRLPLRIQPLHLIELLGGDLRQVPDEQNQAPGFRGSVHFAEGWHAAQTNSIFDCVVELVIAFVLRPGRTQVGRFRMEALAEKRLAPSVIRMARGAMIGEMLHAGRVPVCPVRVALPGALLVLPLASARRRCSHRVAANHDHATVSS